MQIVTLDNLLYLAETTNVLLRYEDLHARHPQLEAYTSYPVIVLDKSLQSRTQEHRVVLAHELGHIVYPPRAGHISYYTARAWDMMDCPTRDSLAVSVGKDERFAMKFATGVLIPDQFFWRFAAAGPHEMWTWLEAFDIPKWFLEFKVGFVRAGQPARERLKWREIILRK